MKLADVRHAEEPKAMIGLTRFAHEWIDEIPTVPTLKTVITPTDQDMRSASVRHTAQSGRPFIAHLWHHHDK